jgi:hypothetical protein
MRRALTMLLILVVCIPAFAAGAGTRSDECGLLVKPNQECRPQRKS